MCNNELDYTEDLDHLEDDPEFMTNGKPFSFILDDDDDEIELTEEEKAEEAAWLIGEEDE